MVHFAHICAVFSPGFFEGVVGGGAGIRAKRWDKEREEREKEKQQKGEEKKETRIRNGMGKE